MIRSSDIDKRYTPTHPEKYVGNVKNIVWRSSWEFEFNKFLDFNPNVLKWASEEIAIPYVKPTDKRIHRYYPDYWVQYKNKNGEIVQDLIEIKPKTQTQAPTKGRKSKKTQLYESVTYAINVAKWAAATDFCKKYGMNFRLVTENELFK